MAESKGFIKIDRNILEWRWANHPNTAWMFIMLLLMANYQDHDFQNITIHRGQLAVSTGNLAQKTGMSYAQARRTLNNLERTGELTIKRYSKFLVITIVKYDEYQTHDNHLPNKSKSNHNHLQIKSQQSKKDKERKEREEGKECRSAPVSPPGEIPKKYRDMFKTYDEYLAWRNQ